MRLLLSTICFSILILSCDEQAEKAPVISEDSTALAQSKPLDSVNVSKFKFEHTEHDFGSIKEGELVKHVFKFTNEGKVDLLISSARGSCGCTIPSYPKEPIPVGGSGEIEVQFNSKGKSGANHKIVSIVGNTYPEVTAISIKANVQPQDETLGPMAK